MRIPQIYKLSAIGPSQTDVNQSGETADALLPAKTGQLQLSPDSILPMVVMGLPSPEIPQQWIGEKSL